MASQAVVVPLARFSRLFDVLNDQNADMVPYATGERELAAEYLLYSSPDDLFLYDRGSLAPSMPRNAHYCARVRHDFHSEVKAFVADGAKERIVVLTPHGQCAAMPRRPFACRSPACTPDSGGIGER